MYNANYMEGVPVKIAEKYKPPPQLYKLPQSLVNKLNLADNHYENSPQFQYHMQLERKALSKITEWKRIRQRNKDVRRERKDRRELQRKQEDEQRQKNLLCSVSYPSTDDLSSTGSEGEGESNPQVGGQKSKESTAVAECIGPQLCLAESTNSFHNILQPTVLSNYKITTYSTATNISIHGPLNPPVKTSPVSAFNYKDFEDDTSSPFDSIELKTINDLDVLAQVLHNTQMKSTSAEATACDNEDLKGTALENANGATVEEQAITKPGENIPKHNNLPKFTYDFGNLNNAQEAQHKLSNYTAGHMYSNCNFSPSLSPQAYILQGQQTHHNMQYQPGFVNANNYYHNNVNVLQMNQTNHGSAINQEAAAAAAKSKSVPDILKELREEIRNSELRRTRNCSHNLENSTLNSAVLSVNETENVTVAAIEDIFDKLDTKSKQLAEQICSMGFPKERVARIVQLLGADDKKIIEHLIPLSELADLGFDECKISEALMRHENNKNKALDDLIS